MKKPNPLGFSSLHLLLALSLPFVLAFLFGCKRAKEEKADLGPEVDVKAIDAALNKVSSGASLSGLHVGEYLNYVILRRLEDSEDVSLMGTTNVSVVDANSGPQPAQTTYTLQINKSARNPDGSFQNVTSQDSLVVSSGSAAAAVAGVPTLTSESSSISSKSLMAWAASKVTAKETKVVRYSYHHLRESDDVMDAPDKVKAKSDCGGLAGCRIPVHYIQFDLVSWFNDTDYQKVSLDFGFSTRTPFLPFGAGIDTYTGLLVIDCRSTYVQLETRNVFVRDCQTVDDFQK